MYKKVYEGSPTSDTFRAYQQLINISDLRRGPEFDSNWQSLLFRDVNPETLQCISKLCTNMVIMVQLWLNLNH